MNTLEQGSLAVNKAASSTMKCDWLKIHENETSMVIDVRIKKVY